MNPAIVSSLTPSINKIVSTAIGLGLTVTAGYFIKKWYEDEQRRKALNQFGNDPSVKQALDLQSSFNPSGIKFLQNIDGRNIDTIYQIAKEIQDYPEVIKAYKKLQFGELDADFRYETTPEEYTQILTILEATGSGIIRENAYKYVVGQNVQKIQGEALKIYSRITLLKDGIKETLKGQTGDNAKMTIISRGKLTIKNLDRSLDIINFYKVRFLYDGFLSDYFIEGWVSENTIIPYENKSSLDDKGLPYTKNIGQTVYKVVGEIRLKDTPIRSDSIFDTVLGNDYNNVPFVVEDRTKVRFVKDNKDMISNFYLVTFNKDGIFSNTTVSLWVNGGSIK